MGKALALRGFLAVCLVLAISPASVWSQTQPPHPIMGAWLVRDQNLEVVTQFNPNGVYQRRVSARGQAPVDEYGNYQLHSANQVRITLSTGQVLLLNFQLLDPNTLRLVDDQGNGMEMARQSGPAPLAPAASQPDVFNPQGQPGGQPPLPQPAPWQPSPGQYPTPPPPAPAPNQWQSPPVAIQPQAPPQGQYAPAPASGAWVFQPAMEPREQAFRILIPRGWQMAGGILRINPITAGGPGNSIAGKVDFAVMKDQAGSVMIRWLPSINYMDRRYSATIAGVPMPQGPTQNGLVVMPLHSALNYLQRVALPHAHPQATGWRVLEQKPLPQLVRVYQGVTQARGLNFNYDAALLRVTYQENGVGYEEAIVTVIEDMGQLGVGMWSNKDTTFIRAPMGQLKRWEAVLRQIQDSVKLNPQWLDGELRGQMIRSKKVMKHQREMNRMAQEILDHKRKTYEEIRNDMYLTMTNQEEYVNPYTNEVDMGSNQWKHRWVNGNGEVVYTDDPNYNPNRDSSLNRTDYRPSPIRPRRP